MCRLHFDVLIEAKTIMQNEVVLNRQRIVFGESPTHNVGGRGHELFGDPNPAGEGSVRADFAKSLGNELDRFVNLISKPFGSSQATLVWGFSLLAAYTYCRSRSS